MKKRLNAHIYVTQKCNLHCKHCYSANNNVQGDLLSIDDIKNIINTLTEKFDAYIDIEGGELFIRKDIPSLFSELNFACLNRITITTNGTIYPNIDPIYLKELDEFRVSIEGHTDLLHNELRDVPLENVIANCQKWIGSDIPVVLRMTLTKNNHKHIKAMFDVFQKKGFRRFSLYEFQLVGRGRESMDSFGLSEIDVIDVINSLLYISRRYDHFEYIKLSLSNKRDNLVSENMFKLLGSKCKISSLVDTPSVTINYNGDIGFCPWNLNFNRSSTYNKYTFFDDVNAIINKYHSIHNCQHCTKNRLLFSPD